METKILQLRVNLEGSKPKIWRKLLVSEDITFHKVHKILQVAMGWQSKHMYSFQVGDIDLDDVLPDYDTYRPVKSSMRVKLSKFNFDKKDEFTYVYDFGDYWQHDIVVEKVLNADEVEQYPICLEGKGDCPPEDIGGVDRYNYLIKMKDDIVATKFSLEAVNEALKKIK